MNMFNIISKMLMLLALKFFCVNSQAQSYLRYYEEVNKAEIAFLDEKYELSDSLFNHAFSLVKRPFYEDYLTAAKNASKLNDTDKTFACLDNGIKRGLTLNRIRKEKKQLTGFLKTDAWKKLKKNYKEERDRYLQTLNLPLRKQIAKMIRQDQRVRVIVLSPRRMLKIDKRNYQTLQAIIKENDNQWPGFSQIGEITVKNKYDVSRNITLLLLHFKDYEVDSLQPVMLKAVLQGEIYPYQYARIIDYKFEWIDNSICQKYGTYLNVPVCDCSEAEAERAKIGFEPLKDYYRKRGYEYKCIKQP